MSQQRPESNDPRDIAVFVSARMEELRGGLIEHMDSKFDELRTLFMSGFPDGDPAQHRAYHREQIELISARKQFYRDLIGKGVFGLIAALAGVVATALWIYLKNSITK